MRENGRNGPAGPARRLRAGVGAGALGLVLALAVGCSGGSEGSGGASGGASSRAGTKPTPKPTPTWDRSPSSLVAVGDSITRGFDACSVLADCPEASWATGTQTSVNSLAVRLLGAKGAAERSWNLAVTGSRISDLPRQMERAAEHRPELVTVMTGANDACRSSVEQMTSVGDFRASFERALRELRKALPKTQVYVASVPDLKRLWSQGRGNPLGTQVWKLGICPSMLGDAEVMDAAAVARRDAVRGRVVAYNSVLGEVCGRDAKCRYDGGAVFNYAFGGAQLSPWDWFHPSVDGQGRLAEMAYRGVTEVR
ncbi:SGNH/GDSL hydrolase family protein [Streptomyces sp. NBC_00237]|uniref:SGNH/GDSL hydrolase family protein n=1 Tax=Streptomyces sp. NBC_00237 TaxID=2975687 RepID=UPI002257A163|nr:SGNH/GDSL hydrolase family protein [Streptomyces sp. NBC_00237]MCX5201398.1 SGNH/GDSL hydrolase family protein [Streptomyces sp. NBC_00237]